MVSPNLIVTFTPVAGGSLTPGEPLPDGTFTKSGTDRKIIAGEIRATLGDGDYVRTTWRGCGEDPTRTFVPVS